MRELLILIAQLPPLSRLGLAESDKATLNSIWEDREEAEAVMLLEKSLEEFPDLKEKQALREEFLRNWLVSELMKHYPDTKDNDPILKEIANYMILREKIKEILISFQTDLNKTIKAHNAKIEMAADDVIPITIVIIPEELTSKDIDLLNEKLTDASFGGGEFSYYLTSLNVALNAKKAMLDGEMTHYDKDMGNQNKKKNFMDADLMAVCKDMREPMSKDDIALLKSESDFDFPFELDKAREAVQEYKAALNAMRRKAPSDAAKSVIDMKLKALTAIDQSLPSTKLEYARSRMEILMSEWRSHEEILHQSIPAKGKKKSDFDDSSHVKKLHSMLFSKEPKKHKGLDASITTIDDILPKFSEHPKLLQVQLEADRAKYADEPEKFTHKWTRFLQELQDQLLPLKESGKSSPTLAWLELRYNVVATKFAELSHDEKFEQDASSYAASLENIDALKKVIATRIAGYVKDLVRSDTRSPKAKSSPKLFARRRLSSDFSDQIDSAITSKLSTDPIKSVTSHIVAELYQLIPARKADTIFAEMIKDPESHSEARLLVMALKDIEQSALWQNGTSLNDCGLVYTLPNLPIPGRYAAWSPATRQSINGLRRQYQNGIGRIIERGLDERRSAGLSRTSQDDL